MSAPHVSVVVPVFNARRIVPACLDSLLRLEYPRDRLEILVVDNGSTDGTHETLARYRDDLTCLTEPRRGPAAARNRGIRAARGAIVAMTDADCVVAPDWLSKLIPPLSDPAVGVSGGRIRSRQPCNRIEAFGERVHDHERALTGLWPPYAITMSWASRKEVLDEVGGFDPALRRSEDSDLAFRIFDRGYRFRYVHDAVVFHRNERTLLGLFREGYLHGVGGVALRRKHAAWLRRLPPPPGDPADRPGAAVGGARPPVPKASDELPGFQLVYQAGKRIGRMAGVVRHGHDRSIGSAR